MYPCIYFFAVALAIKSCITEAYTTTQSFHRKPFHIIKPVKNSYCRSNNYLGNDNYDSCRFGIRFETRRRKRISFPLHLAKVDQSTSTIPNKEVIIVEEEQDISDVDSRVLQAMLQDAKLDLKTEEDVRKLLERGTTKTIPTPRQQKAVDTDDSQFSSTIIKTLSDTKLWRSFRAKSNEMLESVGIWVANKVEQDVKVLAALGLFAWDRAVQDVARALPEARQQVRRASVLLLSNSSSFDKEAYEREETEWKRKKELEQDLIKPVDEIKSVSRAVFSILSGQRSSSSLGRGLRTTAPAGSVNSAERQRRAFVQSQKLKKQKNDITKVPGLVLDSAWELKNELKAERNVPGYKTEPIRKAIAAAAIGTGNLLQEASTKARLAATKRKEMRALKEASKEESTNVGTSSAVNNTSVSDSFGVKNTVNGVKRAGQETSIPASDLVGMDLISILNLMQNEMDDLSDRLNQCIQSPGDIWLQGYNNDTTFLKNNLREIVTKMIVIRNTVDAETLKPFTPNNAITRVNEMRVIFDDLNDLCQLTKRAVSISSSDLLRSFLIYGTKNNTTLPDSTLSVPVLLSLDEFASQIELLTKPSDTLKSESAQSVSSEDVTTKINGAFFAQTDTVVVDMNEFSKGSSESTKSNSVKEEKNSVKAEAVVEVEGEIFTGEVVNNIYKTKVATTNRPTSIIDSVEAVDVINVNGFANGANYAVVEGVIDSRSSFADVQEDYAGVGIADDNDDKTRIVFGDIISDDDFDALFDQTKRIETLSADELAADEAAAGEKEPNLLAELTLRSLDVIFFVLEKFITVGLPTTIVLFQTVATRLNDSRNEGKGTTGWRKFNKLAKNARGRY